MNVGSFGVKALIWRASRNVIACLFNRWYVFHLILKEITFVFNRKPRAFQSPLFGLLASSLQPPSHLRRYFHCDFYGENKISHTNSPSCNYNQFKQLVRHHSIDNATSQFVSFPIHQHVKRKKKNKWLQVVFRQYFELHTLIPGSSTFENACIRSRLVNLLFGKCNQEQKGIQLFMLYLRYMYNTNLNQLFTLVIYLFLWLHYNLNMSIMTIIGRCNDYIETVKVRNKGVCRLVDIRDKASS